MTETIQEMRRRRDELAAKLREVSAEIAAAVREPSAAETTLSIAKHLIENDGPTSAGQLAKRVAALAHEIPRNSARAYIHAARGRGDLVIRSGRGVPGDPYLLGVYYSGVIGTPKAHDNRAKCARCAEPLVGIEDETKTGICPMCAMIIPSPGASKALAEIGVRANENIKSLGTAAGKIAETIEVSRVRLCESCKKPIGSYPASATKCDVCAWQGVL